MVSPSTHPTYLGYPRSSPAGQAIASGSEVSPDIPRQWIEFSDPEDPSHLFSVDATWLLSHWECHFGRPTCRGMSVERPDAGCCAHGAILCDEDDRDRLYNIAATLDSSQWQNRPAFVDEFVQDDDGCELEPWLEWDEITDDDGEPEPAVKTKVVDGACIFANRPGFPAGSGCSLHHYALRNGLPTTDVKPEVCWIVPLSRDECWETRSDGEEILRTTIGEYHRRTWGDGGEDFPWWCTGSPSCHTASIPLWKTYENELRTIMGDASYEVLVDLLTQIGPGLQHPATIIARKRIGTIASRQ